MKPTGTYVEVDGKKTLDTIPAVVEAVIEWPYTLFGQNTGRPPIKSRHVRKKSLSCSDLEKLLVGQGPEDAPSILAPAAAAPVSPKPLAKKINVSNHRFTVINPESEKETQTSLFSQSMPVLPLPVKTSHRKKRAGNRSFTVLHPDSSDAYTYGELPEVPPTQFYETPKPSKHNRLYTILHLDPEVIQHGEIEDHPPTHPSPETSDDRRYLKII